VSGSSPALSVARNDPNSLDRPANTASHPPVGDKLGNEGRLQGPVDSSGTPRSAQEKQASCQDASGSREPFKSRYGKKKLSPDAVPAGGSTQLAEDAAGRAPFSANADNDASQPSSFKGLATAGTSNRRPLMAHQRHKTSSQDASGSRGPVKSTSGKKRRSPDAAPAGGSTHLAEDAAGRAPFSANADNGTSQPSGVEGLATPGTSSGRPPVEHQRHNIRHPPKKLLALMDRSRAHLGRRDDPRMRLLPVVPLNRLKTQRVGYPPVPTLTSVPISSLQASRVLPRQESAAEAHLWSTNAMSLMAGKHFMRWGHRRIPTQIDVASLRPSRAIICI
jgi:hypothetical protein